MANNSFDMSLAEDDKLSRGVSLGTRHSMFFPGDNLNLSQYPTVSTRNLATINEYASPDADKVKTFQPKKRKTIVRYVSYFDSRRDLLNFNNKKSTTNNSTNITDGLGKSKNEESFQSGGSAFVEEEEEVDDEEDEKKGHKRWSSYNLCDVLLFTSPNENVLKKTASNLPFEIHEMQRNRISHDSEFAIVTILYEDGVQDLFPSVRKELILSVMKNSCFFIQKKVDDRLRFDDTNFKDKILKDSALVIYWVKKPSSNDSFKSNIEALSELNTYDSQYNWEAVVFCPEYIKMNTNILGVRKFKVNSDFDIRESKDRFFVVGGKRNKLFSLDGLKNKFKSFSSKK